jgi:hypothetical protein
MLIELFAAGFFGCNLALASEFLARVIIMYVKPNDSGTSSSITE